MSILIAIYNIIIKLKYFYKLDYTKRCINKIQGLNMIYKDYKVNLDLLFRFTNYEMITELKNSVKIISDIKNNEILYKSTV